MDAQLEVSTGQSAFPRRGVVAMRLAGLGRPGFPVVDSPTCMGTAFRYGHEDAPLPDGKPGPAKVRAHVTAHPGLSRCEHAHRHHISLAGLGTAANRSCLRGAGRGSGRHARAHAAPARGLDDLPPVLGPADFSVHTCPGQSLDVHVGQHVLAATSFRPDDPDLAGYVSLDFGAFTWLEEDEEVVGHPHDPFKRIDALRSSRHVVVALNGTVLADTTRAVALLETGLPTRWYFPREDVRMELLESSSHRTTCAYKGHASYYSVMDARASGRDIAWTYPEPLHDAEHVRDLVCFFSERTDLSVDGAHVVRPVTPWSPPHEQMAQFEKAAGLSGVEFGERR